MTTFGKVLREKRQYRKLTQKAVAELIGISSQYLDDIERDRRNPPSDEMLEKLEDALATGTDVLFYHAGRIPKRLRNFEVRGSTIAIAWYRFHLALEEGSEVGE